MDVKLKKTSLNAAFLAKCRKAAKEAIHLASCCQLYGGSNARAHAQGQSYIKNRRGKLMMRVDYQYGRVPALRFWYQSKVDVTEMVQGALGGVL